MALVDEVWAALGRVTDPEYPLSIVDLGMVYGVRAEGGAVTIEMTFTSIGCPAVELIVEDVRRAVASVPGVQHCTVEIVWSPPWTKERITPRGRRVLSMYGVVP